MSIGVKICKGNNGGGGTSIHNQLSDIQGGNSTERFHVSESQHSRLLELIYEQLSVAFTRTPTTIQEKGVSTAVALSWNIAPNDDLIISRTINQGIGVVSGNTGTISGGNRVDTTSYTLTTAFTRDGVAGSVNNTVVVNFTAPQYFGSSNVADVSELNYTTLGATLTKEILASDTMNKIFNPTAQYIWFVSRKNNANIIDGSLQASVGPWNDGVSEFYKKTVTFILADGVTTHALTFYRSRELKTRTNANYTLQ